MDSGGHGGSCPREAKPVTNVTGGVLCHWQIPRCSSWALCGRHPGSEARHAGNLTGSHGPRYVDAQVEALVGLGAPCRRTARKLCPSASMTCGTGVQVLLPLAPLPLRYVRRADKTAMGWMRVKSSVRGLPMAFSRSQTHADFIGAITPHPGQGREVADQGREGHVLSQGFPYFRFVQLLGGHHLPGHVVCF